MQDENDLHPFDPLILLNQIQIKINIYKLDKNILSLIYSNNKGKNTLTIIEYKNIFNNDLVNNFFENYNSCKFIFNNMLFTLELNDNNLLYEVAYPIFKEKTEIEYILTTASSRIRYPLTNIAGLVPIIRNYNETDKLFQQYVGLIQNSSGDIISVANDLIDILNYKKNKVIIKKEEVNINKLIKMCINIVNNKNLENKLLITHNVNNGVPNIIYSDKDKIKQILLILLSNSLKFTKLGSIVVSVSVDKIVLLDSLKKYTIIFKITDTGLGIDSDKQKVIKNLFNDNLDTCSKLSGFGLYIANYTCKMLNGKLWFSSIVDTGTVFYFSIECECLE